MKITRLSFCIALITVCFCANASIKLPKVIGDNMVLQSKQALPVWGWADKGSSVTVKFGNQQKTTETNADGYWKIILSPIKASAEPAQMQISSGTENITLNNILVGEVWLCSGQSNMEYGMKKGLSRNGPLRCADSAALELTVNNPQIRLFRVEKKVEGTDVVTTGWQECRGEALEQFSAAGYFFAKNINNALHVPIGMLFSAWGGTQIEPWTPSWAYAGNPVYIDDFVESTGKINGQVAGRLYNGMVKPMAPFAIKGMLWYQGESNAITHDGMHYADKMKSLVDSWRKDWEIENLPVYSVALAPCYYTHRKDPLTHTTETLPELWEAQTASLAIPNTEMVVVSDLVENLGDIHPTYKWELGRRLAVLALAKQYGHKKLEYTGPRFKGMQVKDNKVILSFTHADGLKANDGKALNWFEIAGSDGVFKQANAEINGNKVMVSNPEVTQPQQLHLGWNEIAQPNLVNNAGFPAMQFRAKR
jgi:sialate O-acetylesterase